MNVLRIVVVAAVWTAMVLAVGRILYLHETKKIDRIRLTDLTDNEPDYDPGGQACEHTRHSNDDQFRLWTRDRWNDMNSKETS